MNNSFSAEKDYEFQILLWQILNNIGVLPKSVLTDLGAHNNLFACTFVKPWRSCKIITKNYFTTNILRFLHIRLNVYTWKTTFTSHKHYLFGVLKNSKKIHTDQSWKVAATKCVYVIDTTYFDVFYSMW